MVHVQRACIDEACRALNKCLNGTWRNRASPSSQVLYELANASITR